MINNINNKKEIVLRFINNSANSQYFPYTNDIITKSLNKKIVTNNRNKRDLFDTNTNRLKNINYDIKNIKNYGLYICPYNNILYKNDNNTYKIINKKPHYKDISLLQILKILYNIHKINKYDYKDSIIRIKKKKPLKNKIIMFINSYYKTIKTNTNKNTLSALSKKQDNRMRININHYSVLIKKRYSDIIENHSNKINNNNFSKDRLIKINEIIKKEFKTRLIDSNKIVYMPKYWFICGYTIISISVVTIKFYDVF